MKASTVDALIWVLVYGGLLLVGLGLSVKRSAGSLGYGPSSSVVSPLRRASR